MFVQVLCPLSWSTHPDSPPPVPQMDTAKYLGAQFLPPIPPARPMYGAESQVYSPAQVTSTHCTIKLFVALNDCSNLALCVFCCCHVARSVYERHCAREKICACERPAQESVPVPAVPAEVKSAWTAEEALMRSGCVPSQFVLWTGKMVNNPWILSDFPGFSPSFSDTDLLCAMIVWGRPLQFGHPRTQPYISLMKHHLFGCPICQRSRVTTA